MSWDSFIETANHKKVDFLRLYKCLNKSAPLKENTVTAHITNITNEYEAISILFKSIYV